MVSKEKNHIIEAQIESLKEIIQIYETSNPNELTKKWRMKVYEELLRNKQQQIIHTAQLKKARDSLSEERKENGILKKKMEEYSLGLQEKQSNLNIITDKLERYFKDNEDLNRENVSLKVIIENQHDQIEDLTKVYKENIEEIHIYKKQTQEQIEYLNQQIEVLNKLCYDKTEKLTELTIQSQDIITSLNTKIQTLTTEYTVKTNSMQDQLKTYTTKIEELNREHESLKKSKEIEIESLSKKFESEMKELTDEFQSERERALKSYENDKDNLREVLNSEKMRLIQDFENEKEALKKSYELDRNNLNSNFDTEKAALMLEINKINKQIFNLETEVTRVTAESEEELTREREYWQEKCTALEKSVRELKRERDLLLANYSVRKRHYDTSSVEIQTEEEKIPIKFTPLRTTTPLQHKFQDLEQLSRELLDS